MIVTHDINAALEILRSGRVVAFPTGTSYGLAADALQGHALQRVKNLKQRPQKKALTIFLAESLWDEYLNLTAEEKDFLQQHKNQALTLLVKPKKSLEHLAQDGRVGLRIIDHPLMAALAKAFQGGLTATSANISDEPACSDIACIETSFPGLLLEKLLKLYEPDEPRGAAGTTYDLSLGCILDGGTLPPSKPSTVVRLDGEKITVIRPGKIEVQ